MLFNSIEFTIFLPIVFTLYWFIVNRNLKIQNAFLLIISYLFYGWWDYRFLSLIILSSFVDYFVGLQMSKNDRKDQKKLFLSLSIFFNIGTLAFFKYYNFFIESFVDAFMLFGQSFDYHRLNIILPIGISFYTFQTLSYSIDIYKGKMKPTNDIVAFFSFVSFFPQLVAGPIERASNLLPQFYEKRTFEYSKATDGLRQILWGLFKKIVIADNCAVIVNDIFGNYTELAGSVLFLGAILFAFQIYGDFSGYSDVAIGTARLLGFNLSKNFAFPYFSRDIAEFWRRWHISLSTWFRDYIYIPLGGSRTKTQTQIRNVFIIFLISGFWHGANWTFLFWGFLNALYFLPLMLLKKNRKYVDSVAAKQKLIPSLKELFQIGTTFFLTIIAWIFFRSSSIGDGFNYLHNMFSNSLFSTPNLSTEENQVFIFIGFLLLIEWVHREKEHGLEMSYSNTSIVFRWILYLFLITFIFYFGGKQQEFIYFQF